jgi:hypothetical protein
MLEPSERISFAPERILRSVMLRPERWFRPVIPRLDTIYQMMDRCINTLHGDLLVVIDLCHWETRDVDLGLAVEVDGELFAGENCFGVSVDTLDRVE